MNEPFEETMEDIYILNRWLLLPYYIYWLGWKAFCFCFWCSIIYGRACDYELYWPFLSCKLLPNPMSVRRGGMWNAVWFSMDSDGFIFHSFPRLRGENSGSWVDLETQGFSKREEDSFDWEEHTRQELLARKLTFDHIWPTFDHH